MAFVEFNSNTGLIVKTKATILNELKEIFKMAYGSSFVITEGTELYTLLDMLSSQLAETGSAAKAVYDAFSFVTATGTPLDVLCSLAGIARKENESDNALRARYYKFLYTKSVGTVEGLESKLLEHTIAISEDNKTAIIAAVDEVRIVNNTQSEAVDFLGTKDLPAHSIAVVCKHTNKFPTKQTDSIQYTKFRSELSDIVQNYKSLGCGVYVEEDDSVGYNYVKANPVNAAISMSIVINPAAELDDSRKNSISFYIKKNVLDYVNSRKIGEDLLFSGFSSCVYKAYVDIGYDDYTFELAGVSINDKSIATDRYFTVKLNEFAVTTLEAITLNIT